MTNTELITRMKKFLEDEKQLNREENKLRSLGAKAMQDMGWLIDERGVNRGGFYVSFENMIESLTNMPEVDWKKTLHVDFNPVEIRKIDGAVYKSTDLHYYEFSKKAGIQQGALFALVKDKKKNGNLKIKDFIFNGVLICFSARADKITVTRNGSSCWEVRVPGKKKVMMEVINKEVEKFHKRVKKEAALYLTSTDEYERYITEKLIKT